MREHDLQTGPRGLRLRLCSWGPQDGRPLLILHGYLEQGAAWDAVATRLPDRRVVAPDHRGHGLSEHVGAGGFYHFWDYVADVDAVVRHLGAPVDLVGHSMGGTIAALYAATRPERVRKLVLIEGLGPPDATDELLERGQAFLDGKETPRKHGSFPDVRTAAERMRQFNPALTSDEALRLAGRMARPVLADDPFVTRPVPGTFTWTWDPAHRGRSPTPFRAEQHRVFLSAIRSPTLLIDGGASPFRLMDRDERRAALAHATERSIAGAGHLIHHDAPDALADALREFLSEDV